VKELEQRLKTRFLDARNGDAIAYREFLNEVFRLMRGYLFQSMSPKLRSMERVEDLAQDVLLSIHRKRDLYDDSKPLLPWIYAVARHRLIDSIRAEARQPECVEWVEKFDALAVTEIPQLLGEDDGREFLKGLTDQQQQILRLSKIEEHSLQEIADQFHMSISAVKVTIHRSLKQVRKKWS